MGYYTHHTITKKNDGPYEELDEDELKALEAVASYSQDTYTGCGESVKWYDCDEDMKKFSAGQDPKTVYRVYGVGEESDDVWVMWFSNGRQLARWDLEYKVPEDPP